MSKGVVAGVLSALALVLGGAAAGAAPSQFRPCSPGTHVLCGTVTVPLDASGRIPGRVGLHVEVLPPGDAGSKRYLFMVAGGPGQPSSSSFALRQYGRYFQEIFRGYTLVAYDDRGTGRSGRISCPGIGAITTAGARETQRLVSACAHRLGATRGLYSTRANSSDMDAIRQALGADTVSVYGVSYGTEQGLVYALEHPRNVDRLLLDSMAPPGVDPFELTVLRNLPHALDEICLDACGGVTRHAGADLATLANRLSAHPVTATVPRPGLRSVHVELDGLHLLGLAIDSDLNDGIAAELPAAVRAGLAGQLEPLERLLASDYVSSQAPDVNATVNVATQCADGPMPWPQGASAAARHAALRNAKAALTRGATGAFGSWSLADSVAEGCVDWPGAGASTPPRAHKLPGVRVLILSGSRDARTPTPGARSVAAALGEARLLVVPGSGHDVLDSSFCAQEYVRAWFEGRGHADCSRVQLLVSPLGRFPGSPGSGRLSPSQTATVVAQTLQDATALALAYEGSDTRVQGLAGGTLQSQKLQLLRLTRYADVAGVDLSGLLGNIDDARDSYVARVTVGGARAAHGTLHVYRRQVTGELGGKQVSLRLPVAG